MRDAVPDAAIAIATGRTLLVGSTPTGEATDRADPVRGGAGGLLAQALRPALGVAEGAGPEDARRALLAAVSRGLPGADALRVAEMLGELCGIPFPDDGSVLLRSARHDPLMMAEQVERAWLEWLRATCAAQTVVVVLEDLHWGDTRTVSLIEAALRDLSEGPLLVLALARPEVDARFPELWAGRAQRLVLGPLGRKPSERLVRDALGTTADVALVERIVRLSEGNALFLEELVRDAAKGFEREAPALPLPIHDHPEAPATLMAMLQARIERLTPEDRRVLRVASILGEQFRDSDVGALLGVDDRKLDDCLRGLAQREVLAAQPGSARAEHRFRHALVREAAYGTLLESERCALHQAAAEHLARAGAEPAVVAEHFERAGLPARAVSFYRDAALRAHESFEIHDAIRWARRGLACGAEGEVRGVLLTVDASAHAAINVIEDIHVTALEAMSLLQPGTSSFCESASLAIVSAAAEAPASQRAHVPELIATVMQIEPRPDAQPAYARMLARVLASLCIAMPRRQLEPILARLCAISDRLVPSDPTARRWFLWASSRAISLSEPAPWRALQLAEACLRVARFVADRFVEHYVLVWDHELRWWQLGDAAAESRLRAQLQTAIHRKSRVLQTAGSIQLARMASETCDPAALAEAARQMHRITEDARGVVFGPGLAYEHWARIELQAGRPATELAERGRAMLAFAPLLGLGATATLVRALIAERRAADAVRVAGEGLAVVAEFGCAGYFELDIRLAVCEAFAAAGDRERTRAELRDALDQIRIRAQDIADPGWRRSYLTRNAENRRVRALAEAWGVVDPTTALLSGP